MKPRPIVVAVTAVFLVLAAWLAWRSGPVPAPAAATPVVTQTGEVIPSAINVNPPPAAAPSASPPAPMAAAPTRESATAEVEKARRMIVDYHTLMGENPVGTNAEIMHALMGGNAHQAMLGPPDGQTLNDKGELIDPWGTPYFFHQLSRDRMEVHSAGPDRIMGTADDVVVK